MSEKPQPLTRWAMVFDSTIGEHGDTEMQPGPTGGFYRASDVDEARAKDAERITTYWETYRKRDLEHREALRDRDERIAQLEKQIDGLMDHINEKVELNG